jgi:NAD(P)-dependent dehydrogenase (short-subunit alcohol dehydrogenase family)
VSRLANRVAIVTGAGRGLGRAHALFLASQGASVVVNDLGGDVHGEGADPSAAQGVVEEIVGLGGRAVVSGHDVADWEQARNMVSLATETFGDLNVLVNNAGILRDRTLANMEEEEWDAVIRVHLKGHAAPTRHAIAYWRAQAKSGRDVKASVIHTTSLSGILGNIGQANYSAAKLAVVALSRVVSLEASKYGVRSNAVSPSALTRLSLTSPGAEEELSTQDSTGFQEYDPANVSPLIGWLAAEHCPADSQIFHISGNKVFVLSMPPIVSLATTLGRWTLDALDSQLPSHLVVPTEFEAFLSPEGA